MGMSRRSLVRVNLMYARVCMGKGWVHCIYTVVDMATDIHGQQEGHGTGRNASYRQHHDRSGSRVLDGLLGVCRTQWSHSRQSGWRWAWWEWLRLQTGQ